MPRKIRYSIYRWKRPRWEAALCGKHPSFGDVDIVLSFHLILHATSGNFWDWENTIQINWGTPKGKLFNTCLVLARRLMYISLHEPASHGRKTHPWARDRQICCAMNRPLLHAHPWAPARSVDAGGLDQSTSWPIEAFIIALIAIERLLEMDRRKSFRPFPSSSSSSRESRMRHHPYGEFFFYIWSLLKFARIT